jgi:hypothetical protein
MKKSEWRHISDPSRMRRKRNSVDFCFLGMVYFVVERRKSYNWSWSITYSGSDSFFPTMQLAKADVEKKRKPGSVWIIEEIPSLVILGRDFSLCLASASLRNPFESLASADLKHKTMNRLAEDLHRSMTVRDFMFLSANGIVRPLETAPERYVSISRRSDWPLGWKKTRMFTTTLDSMLEVQGKILHLIS